MRCLNNVQIVVFSIPCRAIRFDCIILGFSSNNEQPRAAAKQRYTK